uniref:Uncharacterized protein n=1 Tax=Xanthomonas campestris TaxID=339 RepID=Q56760_XANCA|nr:unknown [Xanthomonas campestris]
MAFTWDDRYILRRIEESDPNFHRIYRHSDEPGSITDAINVIDWGSVKASKAIFEATLINPPVPWLVKLAGVVDAVPMGVFQLKKIGG